MKHTSSIWRDLLKKEDEYEKGNLRDRGVVERFFSSTIPGHTCNRNLP